MAPVRAADAVIKPRRAAFVYIPNGVNVLTWQITKPGADYEFSEPLKALEKHRAVVTPISGLHHPHGIGQAHECAKIWLTGAKVSQEGGAFRNTVSCDQLMAEVTAPHTRFGSLELSISRGDTTLGWSRDGVPLPAEDNPRTVFNRLFGAEPGGIDVQRRRLNRRHSVLDAVLSDARTFRTNLGGEDRNKLDEYLHAVRDVEVRTERLDAWLNVPKPTVDKATGEKLTRNVSKAEAGEYYRTMYDLIVLTLRTDLTRVVTYMSGSESNGLAIPEIGIPQTRHELSHHNGDPEQMARLSRSDALHRRAVRVLPRPARRGQGGRRHAPRPDDGAVRQRHELRPQPRNANLPLVLAGGKGMGFKHGKHLDFNLPKLKKYDLATPGSHYGVCSRPVDEKARLSNLLVTMAQKMGVETEKFADSTAPLTEVLA
jgi:hypothetical protein